MDVLVCEPLFPQYVSGFFHQVLMGQHTRSSLITLW
jgi:hypothetical protein